MHHIFWGRILKKRVVPLGNAFQLDYLGMRVCEIIQNNYSPENVYEFFQINDKEYYYAKTTSTETTILRIPGHKDFSAITWRIHFEKTFSRITEVVYS